MQAQTQATKQLTSATTQQKLETVAQISGMAAMLGGLIANVSGNKELAKIMTYLGIAITILTIVMKIKALFPGAQHGAMVAATGAAVIHSGEVVANAAMMKHVGGAMLDNIGAQLGAAPAKTAGPSVSFDGAVFHGTPSPQYVQSLMNNAVGQLRNSSRTWAFNPTGQ
jgi:hypothetical protein